MKNNLLTTLLFFLTSTLWAQTPGSAPFGFFGSPVGPFGNPMSISESVCTNSSVRAMVKSEEYNRLILGGQFTKAGPCHGGAVPLDSSGNVPTSFNPNLHGISGTVMAVIPDNAGGWYVGGAFSSAGGFIRNKVVRINSSGTVDMAFDPSGFYAQNGTVNSLLLDGSTLYMGGDFTSTAVGSGAIVGTDSNLVVPQLTSISGFSGKVNVAISDGAGGFYVGGKFNYYMNTSVESLAHVLSDGKIDTSFNPGVNGEVKSLFLDNGNLYIGGNFTLVAGVQRNNFAVISATLGVANTINISPSHAVNSIIKLPDDNIAIGGQFNSFNTQAANSTTHAWNKSTETLNTIFPKFNRNGVAGVYDGSVYDIISDGSNGWYVAGTFYSVNGTGTTYLVHILSDGTLDPVAMPSINGTPYTLFLDGTTLYVGGSFTQVQGVARNNFAAINVTNKTLLSINITPNSTVSKIHKISSENKIILQGYFTTVNGQARSYLAAIDSSGSLLPWAPNPNAQVLDLKERGNKLYMIGAFTNIDGASRGRGAAFETSDLSLASWNPSANATIESIELATDGAYIGGQFTSAGGSARSRVAKINYSGVAEALTFTFPTDTYVYDLKLDETNNHLYVFGNFTSIDSISRGYGAKIDISNNSLTSWDPKLSSFPDIAFMDANILVLGKYSTFATGGTLRNGFLSFDPSNGNVSSLDLVIENFSYVSSMALNGSDLYIGGQFYSVQGQSRFYFAKVLASTGAVQPLNAQLNGTVEAMVIDNDIIYLGGYFTNILSTPRNYLGAIDLSSDTLTSWAPVADSNITTMKSKGSNIVIGGYFKNINSVQRLYAAEVTKSTGALTSWNPRILGTSSNTYIQTIAYDGSKFFLGGSFTSVGKQQQNYLLALDSTTGLVTSWNPIVNNGVNVLMDNGSTLFVAGNFGQVDGSISMQGFTEISKSTGKSTSRNFALNSSVNAMARDSDYLYLGGSFNNVLGQSRTYFAKINLTNDSLEPFNPIPSGNIATLAIIGSNLYVSGYFSSISGQTRNNAAAYNLSTDTLNSWDPNPNSAIRSIVSDGTNIYLGGSFTTLNGSIPRANIGRVNSTDGAADSWNPDASTQVNVIDLTYGTPYVGGYSGGYKWLTRNRLLAIDTTSGKITTWAPNVNNVVRSLALKGRRLYVGGQFTQVSGLSRNRLAEVDIINGQATSWNPNMNSIVSLMAVKNNTLYIAGNFTNVVSLSTTRNYAAAFDLTNYTLTNWYPLFNNAPAAMYDSGTSLFLGGSFTTVNGVARSKLAEVDYVNGTHTSWTADTINGSIASIAVDSGIVYVGGTFTLVGSTERKNLASFDQSSAALTSWAPSTDSSVQVVHIDGAYAYIAGFFSYLNGGTPRKNFALVHKTSGSLSSFNPLPSGSGLTLLSDAGGIYFGGSFNDFNSVFKSNFTYFSRTTGLNNW